ncbi:MAG: hypothetical protein AMJ93_07325 [Anaerolineae bacterium SM23_84]|nr:MAG: hypothetical protein AMJ93_07325 [Anaerolineae bacterium SM23_84]
MKAELEASELKRLVRDVLGTRSNEIDCDECLRQLDEFVEMTLSGQSAADAMPLVQQHLEQCDCCREEFEALLAVLTSVL